MRYAKRQRAEIPTKNNGYVWMRGFKKGQKPTVLITDSRVLASWFHREMDGVEYMASKICPAPDQNGRWR